MILELRFILGYNKRLAFVSLLKFNIHYNRFQGFNFVRENNILPIIILSASSHLLCKQHSLISFSNALHRFDEIHRIIANLSLFLVLFKC